MFTMGVQEHSFAAIKNVAISCLIMLVTGGCNALGVYNVAIEKTAKEPGSLDGVWSSSMAYLSVTGTISMLLCGVIVSEGSDDSDPSSPRSSKTFRIRILLLLTAVTYLLLGIGGYGVSNGSVLLIALAFSSLGVGFGFCYLIALEVAAAWVPHNSGVAIGICQMAYGLGSVIFSDVFGRLESMMDPAEAVYVTSALMSLPVLASVTLVEWPPVSVLPSQTESDETMLINSSDDGTLLSWKTLPRLPVFWLYIFTVSSAQAGYAFYPYFFDIGYSYNVPLQVQVRCFQIVNVLSTISRPFVGGLYERLRKKIGSPSSARVALMALLGIQLLAFLFLILISSYGAVVVFGGLVLVLFAAGACVAMMAARDLFGKKNSALVFGVGGSLAMGSGEFLAVTMMEHMGGRDESFSHNSMNFYEFAVVWTALGLIGCLFLRKCQQAFEQRMCVPVMNYESVISMTDHNPKPSNR